jgi:hypothetical protein
MPAIRRDQKIIPRLEMANPLSLKNQASSAPK